MTTQLDQVLQALTNAVAQIQVSQQSSDNLAQQMSQSMANLAIRQEMQDQQRAQDLQALSTSVHVLAAEPSVCPSANETVRDEGLYEATILQWELVRVEGLEVQDGNVDG